MVKYSEEASSIIKHAGDYAKTTLKHSSVRMMHILWAVYYHQPPPNALGWLMSQGVDEDMMRAEFAKPNFWNEVDSDSDPDETDDDDADKINLSPEFQKFMEMTSINTMYGVVDTLDIVKSMLNQGETKVSLLLARCSEQKVQPVNVGVPTGAAIVSAAQRDPMRASVVSFEDNPISDQDLAVELCSYPNLHESIAEPSPSPPKQEAPLSMKSALRGGNKSKPSGGAKFAEPTPSGGARFAEPKPSAGARFAEPKPSAGARFADVKSEPEIALPPVETDIAVPPRAAKTGRPDAEPTNSEEQPLLTLSPPQEANTTPLMQDTRKFRQSIALGAAAPPSRTAPGGQALQQQKSFFQPKRIIDLKRGKSVHLRAEGFVDNKRFKELDKTGAVIYTEEDICPLARPDDEFFDQNKKSLPAIMAANTSLTRTNDQVGFLGGAWRSVLKKIIMASSDRVNGLMYTRNMQLFLPFMTGYEAYVLSGLIEAYDNQDKNLIGKMLTVAFMNRNVSRILVQQMIRFDILWHTGTQIAHNRTFDKLGRIPIVGFGAFPASENGIDTRSHALNSILRVVLGKGNFITRAITGRQGLQTDDKNAASQNLAAEVSGFEAANRDQYGTFFGREKTNEFRTEHRLPTDESIVRTFIANPNPTMVNNGIEHTLRTVAKHWDNINLQPSGNFAHQRMEQINPFEIMRFHMPIVLMTLTVQRGLNKWDATVLATFVRKLQLIEPAENTLYIEELMDECLASIVENACGGIKIRVDALNSWLHAIKNSLAAFEATALEIHRIISSVEIGLRLGYDMISTVDWRVPAQNVMRQAILDLIDNKDPKGVDPLVITRTMNLLAPRDKRTMIELVKDGKMKTTPAELLIRRTIILLQREIRRTAVTGAISSLSKGDHVSKFQKRDNYWIEDENGTCRVYTYAGKKTGFKEHKFIDKLTGFERWILTTDHIGIRTYIPVAECITRVQKAYMHIECDHGTKYTLNGLMEFTYLRRSLRNMMVLSQINCEDLDDARLNILKDIQDSDLTNISIRDLVPGRTYYTLEQTQFEPFECTKVMDEDDDDWDALARKIIVTVPPQNMIIIGGGPTGLVSTIHNLENVLITGGNMRLFEARDAFQKGGATFERAQIVRLDARWIAMMRYHLGTIFEDVYIPGAGETDSHQGNSLPTQGFVEITIKDLESMLHLEVCRLLSKGLLQHDTNAGANYDVKTNSLKKLGKSLKKNDLIFHNLDPNGNKSEDKMYSWKVAELEYNIPIKVEDLKIGQEYSVYIPAAQENHQYQLTMMNLSTETLAFTDLEENWEPITVSFDQVPSLYPKGTTQHSAVKKVMLECTLPSDTFSYAQDELDFSGIQSEKFAMDIQHTHVVEAIGKPVGSKVHFQSTTHEPYGVCCISGLKISLGMHNFGSKRWGDGLVDDIRSHSDQNTRIIGDFTKNVKTSLIAERMHEFFVRKNDADWRLHFEKFVSQSGFDIGDESITDLLAKALKEYARTGKECRRPFLQTRFFETGDFYYLGMEFTREYDTWKNKFTDSIAQKIERKLSNVMKPRDKGRFKGGLGHNIDRLWFDACLESIRLGDVYNPGARDRVPHLYLIDSYTPTSLSTLPVGEAFVVDNGKASQRYEILVKTGSTITCRTVEGILKHFSGSKQVRRGGNLARGPDGIVESKVALATFPVAHYVNYRCMRLNNVDNGYSFGFMGDEQSTPHFMRYSGLTGACINGYLFSKFVQRAIEGEPYITRARKYMTETNWNNGEVVTRGTGANYGRDGFLRPGFSYAHGLDYLRSKVVEHLEFDDNFEEFLSRDWKIKFAASWIPKRLEMDDNFMDELQALLKKAIQEQFIAEIAQDGNLWDKPHEVLLKKIFTEIDAYNVGKVSIEQFWDQVEEKLGNTDERVLDFHVPVAMTLEQAVQDIMDFSRQYYDDNKRISSELETQPKSVDYISDDFAVQAQNFTASLTFSAALSSAALAVLVFDSPDDGDRIQNARPLPRVGAAILSALTPFIAFATITNASQYKNRNELSREVFKDKKYLPFLQEIFSFMTKADQVATPLDRNPFYQEINDLATKFVNDCHYYDQKTAGDFNQHRFEPTEFMNEFRTFAISPCDDACTAAFLNSLQKKLIPQVFQENSYLQERLTDLTAVLKRLLEYNDRRYRTSSEASLNASILLERVHCFEHRLDESLQRGNVYWGFFKTRRARHGHVFTAFIQFLYDKIWVARPGAIPNSIFAARSRSGSALRPISAETIEIKAHADALIAQLNGIDTGGLHRGAQDLTQFYHATKESYVSSLIVVSGVLSFFTGIIFTVGNIGAAATDNSVIGWIRLTRIATYSFGFVTPITALLSMFHLFRKFWVLWGISGKLGSKRSIGSSHQSSTISTVRTVARTAELVTLMRFTASAGAATALYWTWVNAEPLGSLGYGTNTLNPRLPAYIGVSALGLHILSIFFLLVIEYFLRYRFDPKLGEHLSESFKTEISEMYRDFSLPPTNIDTKQDQENLTWEYVSREFLHKYRFDTVFAADRFSALYHYLQSGLHDVDPMKKKEGVL